MSPPNFKNMSDDEIDKFLKDKQKEYEQKILDTAIKIKTEQEKRTQSHQTN